VATFSTNSTRSLARGTKAVLNAWMTAAIHESCTVFAENADASSRGRMSGDGMMPNMRMQLTRPRGRWLKADRLSNASLQLIRGR
jgi:hypothetical protein